LGHWLLWFGVPSIFSIVATFAVLRWIFRKELRGTIQFQVEDHSMNHHGKLVLRGLVATAVVLLVASGLDWNLGLPTCLTALFVTLIVSVRARNNPLPLFREISWSTLALVAGLFLMVDAVESIGAMAYTKAWLSWVETLAPSVGALLTAFVVGIANNLVNNLPLGLIAGGTLQAAHAKGLLASAVLLGVDLGPNLSITGSLATILWLIALRRKVERKFLELPENWRGRDARGTFVGGVQRDSGSVISRRELISFSFGSRDSIRLASSFLARR